MRVNIDFSVSTEKLVQFETWIKLILLFGLTSWSLLEERLYIVLFSLQNGIRLTRERKAMSKKFVKIIVNKAHDGMSISEIINFQ